MAYYGFLCQIWLLYVKQHEHVNTESEKVHFIHLVPYSNGKPKLCTENNDIVFWTFCRYFQYATLR